jgi:SOS-response transcriptional repressor LexA
MPSELTERQRTVYEFVRRRLLDTGAPPTARQIVAHIGATSPNALAVHLRALIRKGYLRAVDHRRGAGKCYVPAAPELVAQRDGPVVRVGTTGPLVLSVEQWEAWLRAELTRLAAG